eukprot:10743382-Ditylum_brightwellii.AAC.1
MSPNRQNEHMLMYRPHNKQNGLWYLSLHTETSKMQPVAYSTQQHWQPTCNNMYGLHVKQDMVQYLHAPCFSPVPSTWCKAIRRGYFATFPGLTEKL